MLGSCHQVRHRVEILTLCAAICTAQTPRFESYPSDGLFKGTAAPPQLVEPWAGRYRTQIRNGVTKNYGAFRGFEYVKSDGPNFAGHYFVVNWGCGTGCLMMVVVDAITGHVYPPPLSIGKVGEQIIVIPNLGTGWADFDYRPNSRLFMMQTCPLDYGYNYPFSGTSYFTMETSGWRLIRRVKCEKLE